MGCSEQKMGRERSWIKDSKMGIVTWIKGLENMPQIKNSQKCLYVFMIQAHSDTKKKKKNIIHL